MLAQTWDLLVQRWDFFSGLLLEHVEICLVAVLIAIVFGGIAGILISEYQKAAKPTLGLVLTSCTPFRPSACWAS